MKKEGLLSSEICFVTLGKHGIFCHSKGEYKIFKGHKVSNADVSGAGDTVIAVLTKLYLGGFTPSKMSQIANKCGALVVKKPGIAQISYHEFKKSS